MVLMLITALFNLFLTPGEPIVQLWIFKITAEGAQNAVLMAIRLTYLILGTSIMTLTTTPNQLTDGLEKSLMPTEQIGIPVHAIANDDVYCTAFYPDPDRGDGQNHESTDGAWGGF